MFKKIILTLVILLILFTHQSFAIYDPTTRPNNIFGIHILDTQELDKAARLINSTGGDWGYVTIPIQYGDRDIEKWQNFMDDARRLHVIPILRIATEAYYANTNVWSKPTDEDIIDFANFLNSLTWPTQNRYVLIFNEPNRFDEWGGTPPSPEEYADRVVFAVNVFKSQSPDFFMIAGGLDNASPNDHVKYLDNYAFLKRIAAYNPDFFKKIDGFASHSYPNPNFAQPPSVSGFESTSTYKHEMDIVDQYSGTKKPVFITETGWNADVVPATTIASYLTISMIDIWGEDKRVVAVTPFILQSNGGAYDKFTFYKGDTLTPYAATYQSLSKVKGDPQLTVIAPKQEILGNETPGIEINFVPAEQKNPLRSTVLKAFFKDLFAIGK
ncbi:MAG TPA: hypothetical protein VG965_04690 [Patescibacteria group bacterium]|nr:hypothetical protein [Patescibacteria group bacterium]